MFLVPHEEIDDLEMESFAIETFRPPARPDRHVSRPEKSARIDFSAGYEADEDVEDGSEAAGFRPRPANRSPVWKTAKQRTSQGSNVPVSVFVGVPAAIAVLALIVFFVVSNIYDTSIAEITGLDQAGGCVHVTGREVWVVVEPLSAADADQDRIASVEFRKKHILSEVDKLRPLRAAQGRIDQGIAKSIETSPRIQLEVTALATVPPRAAMPRSPRSHRSGEIRRQMMGGARIPAIPGNTGGAAAGLRPVNDAENRGRPLVGVTVGSGDESGGVDALRQHADSAQVQKVAGKKDAFDIAMERIRDPHRQEDVKYGMGILSKNDLKGRGTQLFSAFAPYLDSPIVENAAYALVVLERIDDPRRVDEVVSRLVRNRQTDPIFCNVLVKWKDPRAIEPLANQLDGFPLWKRFDKAHIEFGDPAEKAVIAKLASPEKDARKRACENLGQTGGEESLRVFAKLKPDPDPFVRMAASSAITSIRNRLGIPACRTAGR